MVNTLSLGVVVLMAGSALAGYAPPPPAPSTVVIDVYLSSAVVVSIGHVSTVPCSLTVHPAKPTTIVTKSVPAPSIKPPTTVLPVFVSGAARQAGVVKAIGVLAVSVVLGMLL
jgi:hypothetical protein